MKFALGIRPDWEVEAKPIADRFLPTHPQNLRGKLPYWYLRSRFKQYATIDYDLPNRGLTRNPDYGEALFILNSAAPALGTTYFGLGAILPYHDLFFRAMWEIDFTKEEIVKGDKLDPDAPWAFRFFDDIPVTLEAGNYQLKIVFNSVNGYGKATVQIYTSVIVSNVPTISSLVVASPELKKGDLWNFSINSSKTYILRITTGSKYFYKVERV